VVALWRGVAQTEGLAGLTLEPALLAGVEKKTIQKEEKKWGRRYIEKKRKKSKEKVQRVRQRALAENTKKKKKKKERVRREEEDFGYKE
jgi:hypothetical protein